MQLSVTGHHIDITESLRNYVGTKLAKLERHFDHMTDIHCVLTVEKAAAQSRSHGPRRRRHDPRRADRAKHVRGDRHPRRQARPPGQET